MKRYLSFIFAFIMVLSLVVLPPVSVVQAEGTDDQKNLYVSDKEFDFESWHTDAMNAYEVFKSLLYSKVGDETWATVFRNAAPLRNVYTGKYVDSVKNATEEEWKEMPTEEVIAYCTTYLNFVTVKNRGTEYFNSHFHSGDVAKEKYFNSQVGISGWNGNGNEELKAAYMKLADLQLVYFEFYNFPYNFHNDKSYAEETDIFESVPTEPNETEATEAPEEIKDFTKDEIEEIQDAIAETSAAHNEASNSKDANESPSYWWIAIIVLAVVGVVVVVKVNSGSKKEK